MLALTAENTFLITLLIWFVGAFGSLIFWKNYRLANVWANSLAIVGAIFGLISSIQYLFYSNGLALNLPLSLPNLAVSFYIDKLAAFFIFVISLIALLASVYALGYVKHYYENYNLGALGFFYNAFLAGMVMVVSAHQVLFFLLAWELMSLTSYFLVIYENKKKENLEAGSLYFIMTHIGTAFIALAFYLLYRSTGSLDFGLIKENFGLVAPLTKNIIFILALIGFGTKAGIIPFHIWLPSAHPAAPSHVSALMSGVMIKTGVYMMIRLFMDVMAGAPLWWGAAILIIGATSSLLGVLYALTEHDIKRLLAYHSIENIGIILLGLGGAMAFWSMDMKPYAILSLTAALFHTLNHAVFKGLLFLGAGAVISATHTRNMEEYGGLIKRLPQTAMFFLIGSLAISALPPFNGFFSEWLTFQSMFGGIMTSVISVRWIFILAAGSLAFTGGLAAMCFVKAFGISFLARPRSEEAEKAKEAGLTLRIGMAILAALALIIGLASGPVAGQIGEVVKNLSIFNSAEPSFYSSALHVRLKNNFAAVSLPLIFISLAMVIALVYLIVTLITRKRKVKIRLTWDCGANLNSRMEITSTGFARSIVAIFRGVLKPTQQVGVEYRDGTTRYFPKSSKVELGIQDIYQNYLYKPLHDLTTKVSEQVIKTQGGDVNIYILYILVVLIALLLIVTV